GCKRSDSPAKQVAQNSPTQNAKQTAAITPPPTSRPTKEDKPITIAAFTDKHTWKMDPGDVQEITSDRRSKHQLTVTVKATPAGAKIAVLVVGKMDRDLALISYQKGEEPKNPLAYHAGGDNVELKADMPAVLPYVI